MMRRAGLAIGLLALVALPLRAQEHRGDAAPPVQPSAVSYRDGALGIAPRWDGLAVVRGAERREVANLHFFWPRGIDGAFAGDSALSYAARAVETRRIAATLTDASALLFATAAVRAARSGRIGRPEQALAGAGAGLLAASVPLHFSADGWLARAVWWHNAAFTR